MIERTVSRAGFRLLLGIATILALSIMGSVNLMSAEDVASPSGNEGEAQRQQYVSLIVTAGDVTAAADAVAMVEGKVKRELWLIDGVAADVPAEHVEQLYSKGEKIGVYGNKQVNAAGTGRQATVTPWSVRRDIGAQKVHARGVKGAGVTIALLDSGVSLAADRIEGEHAPLNFYGQVDLIERECPAGSGGVQFESFCFFRQLSESKDPYGHGTQVAGVIAGKSTSAPAGVAPEARIVSIRVLDGDGNGTYATVIAGLQTAVDRKEAWGIQVLNLSLSSEVTSPYFADPLNQAVEAAWAAGIVVVAAAGNRGPSPESITVPGNDPYVITVGAIDSNQTPADWTDDFLPTWSSTGPTRDGFSKPDLLAPGADIVSFVDSQQPTTLAGEHPAHVVDTGLFQMSSTSMATAVTSGVVAQMRQANPGWTADEIKYRLMYAAQPAFTEEAEKAYGPFQQGAGRLWAPAAVFSTKIPPARANDDLALSQELANRWFSSSRSRPLASAPAHFQGPIRRLPTEAGNAYLYLAEDPETGQMVALGATGEGKETWLAHSALLRQQPVLATGSGRLRWQEEYVWAGGAYRVPGRANGLRNWSGGQYSWRGGLYHPDDSLYQWAGSLYNWGAALYNWSTQRDSSRLSTVWAGGLYPWTQAEWQAHNNILNKKMTSAPTWIN